MSRYRKNGPAFQTGSTQNLTLVVILAISFIAIVIVIAWMALNNVQQKIQADAGDALQAVLQTTHESLA
jgi:type II secretory pathway component PulJ